jgi:hypothetical protein
MTTRRNCWAAQCVRLTAWADAACGTVLTSALMRTALCCAIAILGFGLSLGAQGMRVIMPAEIGISELKGKPFTATARTTLTQVLPDGTKKIRTVEDRLARDSKGRIYQEQHLPWTEDVNHPIYYVNIYDPVRKRKIHIDPQDRNVITRPIVRPVNYDATEYLTLKATHAGESIKNQKLGNQEIAGIKVWGRRTTHTFPPGMFGNAEKIVSVDECWYSERMGVDLLRRRSDPRSGEQVTEILNLDLVEPDPTLFEAPAGYSREALPTRH